MSSIQIIERSDANGKKNDDSTAFVRQGDRAILCIADGVGSMESSDLASGYCTQFVKIWAKDKDANKMGRKTALRELGDLYYRLHDDLVTICKEKGEDLGTTLIVAIVGIGKMILASVGDSRVYVCQNGKCKQVTKDQTVAQDEREGEVFDHYDIAEEEKETTLTQWIGSGKVEPNIKFYEINLEDNVDILLCTDGLYSSFSEKDLYAGLDEEGLEEDLDNLIEKAKNSGETDNISAVLYRRRKDKKGTGKLSAS